MNYVEEEKRKRELNQKLADLIESIEPGNYDKDMEYIDLKSFIDFLVTKPKKDGNLFYYTQGHEDRYTPYDVEEIVYYDRGKIRHVIYDHGVPYYESTTVVTDDDKVVEVIDIENDSPIIPHKSTDEEIIEYYKANKARDFDLSLNNSNMKIDGNLRIPFGQNVELDISNPWNYEFRSQGMFYDFYKADNKLVTELLKRLYVKISDCPEMLQQGLRDIRLRRYSIKQTLSDHMNIKDEIIYIVKDPKYFRPLLLSNGSIFALRLETDSAMKSLYNGPIVLAENGNGDFQEILTKTPIGFGEIYKKDTMFVTPDITGVHIEDVTQLETILKKLYEGKEYSIARTMDHLSDKFVEYEKDEEITRSLVEKEIAEFEQAELKRLREERIILPEDVVEDSLRELTKSLESLPPEQRTKYAEDIKHLNDYYIQYKDFFEHGKDNSITSDIYYKRIAALKEDMAQHFNRISL